MTILKGFVRQAGYLLELLLQFMLKLLRLCYFAHGDLLRGNEQIEGLTIPGNFTIRPHYAGSKRSASDRDQVQTRGRNQVELREDTVFPNMPGLFCGHRFSSPESLCTAKGARVSPMTEKNPRELREP